MTACQHGSCRRQKLADKLMGILEDLTEKVHDGFFVDLFVRKSNNAAINMYKRVRCNWASMLHCAADMLHP